MTSTKDINNKNNMQKLKRHDYSGIKRNKHVSAAISAPYYPQKPITMKEMLTRKINKSLCICLLFTIAVTFVSYYISMRYAAKLNDLDREIVRINNENLDLQADLDRYKSFNNVDSKIGEFKLLQKADKVLEVTAMNPQDIAEPVQKSVQNKFNWALGY